MSEEIRVRITPEYNAAPVKEAEKDIKQLKATETHSTSAVSRARSGAMAGHAPGSTSSGGTHGGGAPMGTARMVGEVLDMTTGSQGWVMRSMMLQRLPHMISALAASPLALAGAAAAIPAALFGTHLLNAREDRMKDIAFGDQLREERLGSARHLRRMGADYAGSGAYRAQAEDAHDNVSALKAKRQSLIDERDRGLFSGIRESAAGNWLLGKSDAQRKIDENEAEIARGNEEQEKADIKKKQRFAEVGAREIQVQKKVAAGDLVGARALQARLDYAKEVERLDQAGASKGEAFAGADAKFAAEIRQHEQSLGGLISARTGTAGTARIASLGDRQFGGMRSAVGMEKAVQEMRWDMNENHHSAMAATSLRRFSSPPLNVQ